MSLKVYSCFVAKCDDRDMYRAASSEFAVECYGNTISDTVKGLISQVESTGIDMLKNGKPLPNPQDFGNAPDKNIVMFSIDIEKAFRESTSDTVRKSVSIPMWMDIALRNKRIDASSMFYKAACKELSSTSGINTVEDLEKLVPANILRQYVLKVIKTKMSTNDEEV